MQPVVLLAVAAVWAAVIIPPLLRSRVENRPNSSVTDFRRQLSTLQRAVPTRTMVPMRGRPLTQAPQQRQAMHGHPGAVRRAQGFPPPGPAGRQAMQGASIQRSHGQAGPSHGDHTAGHRQMHLHKASQRELVRRRRANVLFVLAIAVVVTGFLAATTNATAMVYGFALSFVSLCGYCYKLVQIRSLEADRHYGDQAWFHAA
ncbi:MAG: hypothetical protein Q7V88_17050 [Actinomycetota bacterium]|nr:hypothetical protein [Actinomycetota bacterium]